MASTPVHFQYFSGQTITLHIFALGADAVIVNTTSTATTEDTNRLGNYVCTVTEALAGTYYWHAKIGTDVIETGFVELADDTTTYYCESSYEVASRVGWTTTLTESYAADGAAGTPAQILYMIQQAVTEFAISGTTKTIKKLDGTTTAATETLDDDTSPTSITRAS